VTLQLRNYPKIEFYHYKEKLISEFTQKKFKIYNSHILKTFKMMSVSSMSKREKRIKFLKKELKKMKKKHWPFIDAFYQNEMIPIIEYLKKDNGIINSLKPPLKKYLIISCVSLIERSLLLLTVRIIDEDKIDLDKILGKKNFKSRYLEYNKKNPKITEGQYYSGESDVNFQDPERIKDVFTSLLNNDNDFKTLGIDIFDAIKKIDGYDPYKYVKGTRRIDKNWKNFIKMFEKRHRLIHEMNFSGITDSQVYSFCDNTMNFLDAIIFICIKQFRHDVIDVLKK
jgi:hypothetical protein